MNITKTLAILGVIAAGSSALANTITGTINFNSATGITLDTPENFMTVDFVNFFDNVNSATVGFGSSGDFSSLVGPPAASVAFKDIDVGTSILSLWSTGGFTFDLMNSANLSTADGLIIAGTGIIHNAAFEDTTGTFSLTASRSTPGQVEFTFQATSSAVPDGGATAMLLGVGMLGLGAIRRKVS
jgi:hypothetical protein